MGDMGTGKTAFATSYGSKTEVIDFDNGTATCEFMKDNFTAERQQVKVYPAWMTDPTSAANWQRGKGHVLDICNESRKPGGYKYPIVVIDSLTTASEGAIRTIRSGSGMLTYNKFIPMQIQNWGGAVGEFEQMIQLLRMTPLVVICIAHVEIEEIKKKDGTVEGQRKKPIAVTQRFANKIGSYFDEVYYCRVLDQAGGTSQYVLQTQPTEGIPCRTRRGLPNNTNMNLGLKKVLSMIHYDL